MSNYQKKNSKGTNWVVILILLVMVNPLLIFPLAIGGVIFLVVKNASKSAPPARRGYTQNPGTRQPTYPQQPQRPRTEICFHKDKGEHHVRRGKDFDPWDRPDIDISQYQRRR